MLKDFRRTNQTLDRMSKEIFVGLLDRCLNECLSSSTLESSFTKTAFYPFDVNNFDFSQLPSHDSEPNSNIVKNDEQSSFIEELEKLIYSTFPGEK